MAVGHERRRDFVEGRAENRRAGLGVGVEVAEIVLHCEREKRHAVVEDWRESTRFVAPVVDQQPEVAEVPVDVAHQRVEDRYAAEICFNVVAKGWHVTIP